MVAQFLVWLAGYLGSVHSFSGSRFLARLPAFLAVCLAGWVGCGKIILTEAEVSVSYHFKFCSFCKTSLVSTAFVYSEVELSPFLYCFVFLKSTGCFFSTASPDFQYKKENELEPTRAILKKKSM